MKRTDLTHQFLKEARHSLEEQHLPRVIACLKLLPEEEIWWRPNPASNSVGNMVLHLAGNVRQWIISGLGREPDRRNRPSEFAELGPIPPRELSRLLKKTVKEACQVLARQSSRELARQREIQGFKVTGLVAVAHVVEHFAYHAGQIIYVTKLHEGKDLSFTRLPGEKPRRARGKALSQV